MDVRKERCTWHASRLLFLPPCASAVNFRNFTDTRLSNSLLSAINMVSPAVLAEELLAGGTIIQSPVNPNMTISYKSPSAGTCAIAFDTQKECLGYANLPPYTLAPYQQNYSINTPFWFFESRTSPEMAPLSIWLSGGPESSSMIRLYMYELHVRQTLTSYLHVCRLGYSKKQALARSYSFLTAATPRSREYGAGIVAPTCSSLINPRRPDSRMKGVSM
jgi:hypothetical protein